VVDSVATVTTDEHVWLRRLRSRQRGTDLCVLAFAIGFALMFCTNSRLLLDFLLVTIVLALMGFVVLAAIFTVGLLRADDRRCPRCGENFFMSRRWGVAVYGATRCFNCGFPTAEDLASLRGRLP